MTIDWPGSLPSEFLRQGYKEAFVDTSLRTQMDAGPAKVRNRLVANTKPYTVSLFLTSSQVDNLETFYRTTTSGGALRFSLNDPRTAVSYSFRFVSKPEIAADGANFIATFDIERMP